MINPLIAVRDIHFVSSVIVAGIVFFDLLVAAPTLRTTNLQCGAAMALFRNRTARIFWSSLVLSFLSGFAWLCLLSARIVSKPIEEVVADSTMWIVLSRTQFGFAWELRFVFGLVLAASLWLQPIRSGSESFWRGLPATLLAGAYLGSLAYAGHGQEGLGFERDIHLAVDFVHLIAAGLWLGGLIPLALLLIYLRRFREETWTSVACDAAVRFSNLGLFAVGMLLMSGTINALFLVNGMQSLIDTGYGQLLIVKITLFAAMVCLAGINRQYLLPRLRDGVGIDLSTRSVQWLIRSAMVETALGLGILVIVGILGTMAPATGMGSHLH